MRWELRVIHSSGPEDLALSTMYETQYAGLIGQAGGMGDPTPLRFGDKCVYMKLTRPKRRRNEIHPKEIMDSGEQV